MAVFARVMLARLFGVMLGLDVMSLRDLCVMTGRVVVATFMVVGRRLMVPGGMLVMFSGFAVMFRGLLRHGIASAVDDTRVGLQRRDSEIKFSGAA